MSEKPMTVQEAGRRGGARRTRTRRTEWYCPAEARFYADHPGLSAEDTD